MQHHITSTCTATRRRPGLIANAHRSSARQGDLVAATHVYLYPHHGAAPPCLALHTDLEMGNDKICAEMELGTSNFWFGADKKESRPRTSNIPLGESREFTVGSGGDIKLFAKTIWMAYMLFDLKVMNGKLYYTISKKEGAEWEELKNGQTKQPVRGLTITFHIPDIGGSATRSSACQPKVEPRAQTRTGANHTIVSRQHPASHKTREADLAKDDSAKKRDRLVSPQKTEPLMRTRTEADNASVSRNVDLAKEDSTRNRDRPVSSKGEGAKKPRIKNVEDSRKSEGTRGEVAEEHGALEGLPMRLRDVGEKVRTYKDDTMKKYKEECDPRGWVRVTLHRTPCGALVVVKKGCGEWSKASCRSEIPFLKRLKGNEHIVDILGGDWKNGIVITSFHGDPTVRDSSLAGYFEDNGFGAPAPVILEHEEKLRSQLLAGLDYIHGMGIIHRDLKHWNIVVCKAWRLKILDFGLAWPVTISTSPLNGTPWFLPPETGTGTHYGGEIGKRRDSFAAAVVLLLMKGALRIHKEHEFTIKNLKSRDEEKRSEATRLFDALQENVQAAAHALPDNWERPVFISALETDPKVRIGVADMRIRFSKKDCSGAGS